LLGAILDAQCEPEGVGGVNVVHSQSFFVGYSSLMSCLDRSGRPRQPARAGAAALADTMLVIVSYLTVQGRYGGHEVTRESMILVLEPLRPW